MNATGVAEPVVVTSGTDRIVVEVPGITDTAAIRKLVGTTGQLQFVPLLEADYGTGSNPGPQRATEGQPLPTTNITPLFSGTEVQSATVGSNQQGQRTVNFVLHENGKNLFADYTAKNVGSYFAIVLDGEVISAPVINERIPGGQVQISQDGIGGYPLAAAQSLVTILRSGALPFPLQEIAHTP